GERQRIGDRAVARGSAGEPNSLVERCARQQRLDTLVHIAKPLFETHDGLAIGCEAEMPRLDNAGMNRSDGNLVQTFTLGRQERIRLTWPWRSASAERMLHVPEAEIEPGPRIQGTDR